MKKEVKSKETKQTKEAKDLKKELEKDEPLATMILKDYKQTVQDYKKYNASLIETNNKMNVINKRLLIVIVILIILLAIVCTYIILTWDMCNPEMGIFRNTC